jgi:hypothetical protein
MDSTLEYILSDERGFLWLHTSLHVRRLRPPLPEAWSGQCLSVVGSPWASLTGYPGLGPRSSREAGGADQW